MFWSALAPLWFKATPMEGGDIILLDSTLVTTLKYLSADGPQCRNELFCRGTDCAIASPVKSAAKRVGWVEIRANSVGAFHMHSCRVFSSDINLFCSLRSLVLCSCRVSGPELAGLRFGMLETLTMQGCGLSSEDMDGLCEIRSLLTLKLDSNRITTLGFLQKYPGLT